MKRSLLLLRVAPFLSLLLVLAGCESTGGSVYVGGYYGYGYDYYSPWYRHDVIVRPPPPHHRPPVRPEHPIERPPARPPTRPPVRPTPLPARPMPSRPMPRPAPARMR